MVIALFGGWNAFSGIDSGIHYVLQERSLYARSLGTDRDTVLKQSRRRAALVPTGVHLQVQLVSVGDHMASFMTTRVLLQETRAAWFCGRNGCRHGDHKVINWLGI
jgi:hypothetical protein